MKVSSHTLIISSRNAVPWKESLMTVAWHQHSPTSPLRFGENLAQELCEEVKKIEIWDQIHCSLVE
jgi:hypothetical protein